MLAARVSLGDLIGLSSRSDWVCEPTKDWPKPRATDEYVLVWSGSPAQAPFAIVVPGSVEEFYAWSTTYLAHLTPLSSILRVGNGDEPKKRKVDLDIEAVCGLMFAEAAAWLAARGEEDAPRLEDFLATLSFSLVQAACWDNSPSIEETAARWVETRGLLDLPRAPFRPEHLIEVWATIVAGKAPIGRPSMQGGDVDLLAQAPSRGTKKPPPNEGPWSIHSAQQLPLFDELVEGPVEDRVRKFKDLVKQEYAPSERDDSRVGVLLGAALSRISGGTFRHTRLVSPREVRDVRPLLWYGHFEAIAAKAAGGWFGGAVGTRLAQEVRRRFEADGEVGDRDIDLEELRVLRRGKHSISDVLAKRRNLVRVELHHGVVAEFANPVALRRELAPRR